MALENLASYSRRPVAFLMRYVRGRRKAHAVVVAAVTGAVVCSVVTQYAVKLLVDTLAGSQPTSGAIWLTFTLVVALIAGDNLLWRVAGWVGNSTFVGVTGDVRRDLFRHLTGHAPSYLPRPRRARLLRESQPRPMRFSLWKTCSCGMCCHPAWRPFARLPSLAR